MGDGCRDLDGEENGLSGRNKEWRSFCMRSIMLIFVDKVVTNGFGVWTHQTNSPSNSLTLPCMIGGSDHMKCMNLNSFGKSKFHKGSRFLFGGSCMIGYLQR